MKTTSKKAATKAVVKPAPRKKATTSAKPAVVKPAARKKATTSAKPAVVKPAARKKPTTSAKPAVVKPAARKKATTKTGSTGAVRKAPAKPFRARTSRAPKPAATEVSYSGRIFRSKLEVRWAVLMDLLDINWDYEPSHYQVGPELFYLPDFYLPDHRLWLEVKGPAFMDAQSMAKCLGSVAGPMPLPLREAPYTAAGSLLLGGPLEQRPQGRPVHTLIKKAGPGMASLVHATLDRSGVTEIGVWGEAEADGVAKARRPTPGKVAEFLQPAPVARPVDALIAGAYRFAANAFFDDEKRCLSSRNDPDALRQIGRRRAGRPLGPFPAPRATAAARPAA